MAYPTVTWEGLAAWCAQMRITLEPWEASAMVRLGVLRANILTPQPKSQTPDRTAKK
jgi:hypothetical protein